MKKSIAPVAIALAAALAAGTALADPAADTSNPSSMINNPEQYHAQLLKNKCVPGTLKTRADGFAKAMRHAAYEVQKGQIDLETDAGQMEDWAGGADALGDASDVVGDCANYVPGGQLAGKTADAVGTVAGVGSAGLRLCARAKKKEAKKHEKQFAAMMAKAKMWEDIEKARPC